MCVGWIWIRAETRSGLVNKNCAVVRGRPIVLWWLLCRLLTSVFFHAVALGIWSLQSSTSQGDTSMTAD